MVWSPSHLYHINSIEAVQRAFTETSPCNTKPSIQPTSLNFKVTNPRTQTSDHWSLHLLQYHTRTFRSPIWWLFHRFTLYITPWSLKKTRNAVMQKQLIKTFFFHPASSNHAWNSLTQDLISIKNPKLFKNHLSKANLSQFLTIPYINLPPNTCI